MWNGFFLVGAIAGRPAPSGPRARAVASPGRAGEPRPRGEDAGRARPQLGRLARPGGAL